MTEYIYEGYVAGTYGHCAIGTSDPHNVHSERIVVYCTRDGDADRREAADFTIRLCALLNAQQIPIS